MQKENKETMPHFGNLLVQVMEEKKAQQNYWLQSLQLKLIWRFSKCLDCDFFEHISNHLGDNAQVKLEQGNLLAT